MAMHFQLHWPPSTDLCAVFTVCRSRQVSSYASRMIQNHAMFWQICRSNGSSDLRRASRVRLRILREAKAMACEAQLVLLHLVMRYVSICVEGSCGFELWRAFALSLLHGFGLPKRRNSQNSDQTQVNLLNQNVLVRQVVPPTWVLSSVEDASVQLALREIGLLDSWLKLRRQH